MTVNVSKQVPGNELPLVVICAGTTWAGITGSDHHIAKGLTRYARVLWVDPPVTVLTPANRRGGTGIAPWPKLCPVMPGLTRLTTIALPGQTRPVINASTGMLVRAQIRWALRQLNAKPAAVVACMLDDVLTGWEPDVLRVLYGTDDYYAGAGLMGLSKTTLLKNERRQLANANVVIAISQLLAKRWQDMGAKPLLIPNGVQAAAYRHIDKVEPAHDAVLPAPVAGVIGQLSARIDIAMLEAVAGAGCSLLLVGPNDPNWEAKRFAALVAQNRVAWVGRRTFEELPRYLRAMNAGLTPYALTPFNRASFPLKTLEYLAAGLPVVSTALPATRWLNSNLIRVASNPADFAKAVRDVTQHAPSELEIRRRQDFAAQHSWERRAHEFACAIGLPDKVHQAETP